MTRAKAKTRRFTPGPWRLETRGDGHHIVADSGPEKIKTYIAIARGMRPDNAYLIAAAPDMYEALAAFVSAVDRARGEPVQFYDGMQNSAITKASAAIAKAEGRAT